MPIAAEKQILHLNFNSFPVTHWGQQVFYLPSAMPLSMDKKIEIIGSVEITRAKEYARLYNVHLSLNQTVSLEEVQLVYQIV